MSEKKKQKIRKSVAKMMRLSTEMCDCAEFAPLHFSLGNTGQTIQMYDNESFEKVREAYEIPEEEVRKSWGDGVMHKYATLNSTYELSVVLWKTEDGYESRGEEDA